MQSIQGCSTRSPCPLRFQSTRPASRQCAGRARAFHWAHLLAFVTGLVNQELLLRNEYLIAENRILRNKLPSRLPLSDPDRVVLGEIAKRLGRSALRHIARVARPDTILGSCPRLVAQKFDSSRQRSYPGRPRVSAEL